MNNLSNYIPPPHFEFIISKSSSRLLSGSDDRRGKQDGWLLRELSLHPWLKDRENVGVVLATNSS